VRLRWIVKGTLCVLLLVLVAVLAAAVSAQAGVTSWRTPMPNGSHPRTVRLGKGAGPWRIGMSLVVRPGLVATERFPANDGGAGCTSWSRIDYYRGLRVAWQFAPDAKHSSLVDIATMSPGDRSGDGFVIGKTRIGSVLARYPQHPQRPRYDGSLGLTLLVVEKSTGQEMSSVLKFWFDSTNVLTAIETGIAGC
jgi:hypothetical protein